MATVSLDDADERTLVARYLFSPLFLPAGPLDVVRWWESRRLAYNLTVGAAGLLTLATITLLLAAGPRGWGDGGPPMMAVVAYGVAANCCYSLGAPIDLLLRRWLGWRAGAVGQALFRYGLAFSVGLTLLPIPLFTISWLVSWGIRLFGG